MDEEQFQIFWAEFCEQQILNIFTDLQNERNRLRLEVGVLREKIGEPVAGTSNEDTPPQSQSQINLKKLLTNLMPVHLSDEKLLKVVVLSKVRTEIEQRQTDNGEYNFFSHF